MLGALRTQPFFAQHRLREDWERVDEVNLLSILVHINPCKILFISTVLIPYTFLFCHEHLFPKFTMFFPTEPRVQCRLRVIHIQSADAMLWVYRTVWETKTYSHRHRHNPSRAHRKRDIKENHCGVILILNNLSLKKSKKKLNRKRTTPARNIHKSLLTKKQQVENYFR